MILLLPQFVAHYDKNHVTNKHISTSFIFFSAILSSPRRLGSTTSDHGADLTGSSVDPVPSPTGTSEPRQKSLASDGSPAISNQAWGPLRTVVLERQPGESLGISIVGRSTLYAGPVTVAIPLILGARGA